MSTIPRTGSASRRNLRREGAAAEDLAARFLAGIGFRIVERNFRFRRYGEIDIVARDGEYLVFCEVKMRSSDAFGLPEEAVTPSKQRRIRNIAAAYLAVKGIEGRPCRFDVVSILSGPDPPACTLFRNAF